MRLAVSVLCGGVAFFAMALLLITVKEAIENPLILVAAVMMGLATFGSAYILDMLTTPRE